ncbi:MAG TPA: hypothetical protein VGA08_03195 [Candidatus Saccharimonadales bacterium]|jgi:hypothetical protein
MSAKFTKLHKTSTALLTTVFSFGVTGAAMAADARDRLINVGDSAGFNPAVGRQDLPRTIGVILQSFLALLGVIFMAYIFYAGYLWLTAAGAEDQIGKAKKILRGAIVGALVVLTAYVITTFVIQLVGGAGIIDVGD